MSQITPSSHERVAPSASARPAGGDSRLHLAFLDGLRALAALWVVVFHASGFTWSMGAIPPRWFRISQFWVAGGHYAVSLFIVISGFCLMLPVVRSGGILTGGALQFYKRRAKRILPPYYLALGFSLLLIATLIGKKTGQIWDFSIPPTRSGLLVHLFLVQNWAPFFHPAYAEAAIDFSKFATMSPEALTRSVERIGAVLGDTTNIDPPTWTVAVECQIYLFFPLLVWLWRRLRPAATIALTALTFLFYVRYHTYVNNYMAPHFMALFALGMLGAQIAYGPEAKWQRLREKRLWGWVAFGLAAMVLALEVATSGFVSFVPYVMDVFVGPASMCLLIAVARGERNRLRDILSAPKLVFIGTFSYSIYLIHLPLLEAIRQHLMPNIENRAIQFYILAFPGLALICLVSFAFYCACEQPFLNTRRAPASSPALKSAETNV